MKRSAVRHAIHLVPVLFILACAPEQGGTERGSAASGLNPAPPASPVRPAPAAPGVDPRLAGFCAVPGQVDSPAGPPAGYARRELDPADHLFPTRTTDLDTPLRCVVRTEEQLAALWAQAHRWVSPATTPSLDGGTVVLASMGSRPSTGYGIGIDSVLVRADTALVFVLQRTPGSNCTEGMLVSSPTDAVRIPGAAVVRFHETRVGAPACDPAAGPDGTGAG